MAYLSPFVPALDFSYTYDPVTPTGNMGVLHANEGTLWDYLNQDSRFKILRHMVATARMEGAFNDPTASFTIFAPDDDSLLKVYPMNVFRNIDQGEAQRILHFSTLPRKIKYATLSSSSCLQTNTMLRGQDLYLKTGREGTIVNGNCLITRPDFVVNNAIIHVTDNLCLPVSG